MDYRKPHIALLSKPEHTESLRMKHQHSVFSRLPAGGLPGTGSVFGQTAYRTLRPCRAGTRHAAFNCFRWEEKAELNTENRLSLSAGCCASSLLMSDMAGRSHAIPRTPLRCVPGGLLSTASYEWNAQCLSVRYHSALFPDTLAKF